MSRLVTIMRYETAEQAEFHRELLENAGIPVTIKDDTPDQSELNQSGPLPGLGGRVALMVPEEYGKQAGEVLEESFTE